MWFYSRYEIQVQLTGLSQLEGSAAEKCLGPEAHQILLHSVLQLITLDRVGIAFSSVLNKLFCYSRSHSSQGPRSLWLKIGRLAFHKSLVLFTFRGREDPGCLQQYKTRPETTVAWIHIMGDPYSVVAGAAGIVSLGLTVCSGLLEYYGSWKDSPSDIVTMCESLEALTKTFQLLDEKVRHPLLDRASVDRVTESIISCAAGVQKLKSKLDKICDVKAGMSAHLQRAQYPFRQKTLMSLHQTVSDLRSNLGLAASTLQLDISVTSFHRLNELDTKVKNLIDTSGISSTKVLDGISELRLAQKEERLRSISAEEREAIHWLSPLDFASKHADAVSRRQQGTGRWLLESSEFRSWIQTPGKVLWCPGIRKYFLHLSLSFSYIKCKVRIDWFLGHLKSLELDFQRKSG